MIDEFRGPTKWLSNFYPSNVVYEGVVYPSVENAYQAAKLENPSERKVFESITPGMAKKMGTQVRVRDNWWNINLPIMEDLNRQKFSNDPDLKARLLATGSEELVEGNNWGDTFWGVCNGIGYNHLGKILMKIRNDLNSQAAQPAQQG